jgi:predicted transcriptional regulator
MTPVSIQRKQGVNTKRLLKIFQGLSEQDQKTLLDLAEFLQSRVTEEVQQIPEPQFVHRPRGESVVKAIRRLSKSYYMLDKPIMLNETSTLMAQHVMQGRPAEEVIDELERLFEDQYQKLIRDNQ